jgi:hypothetical protein
MDLAATFPDEQSDQEIEADLEPEPEAGPSRPRKRRKIQGELIRELPQSQQAQEQESYEVVQKKKYGMVVPNEDGFEEEAWGAPKVVPVKAKMKAKGQGKGKEPSEVEDDGIEEVVPLTKMRGQEELDIQHEINVGVYFTITFEVRCTSPFEAYNQAEEIKAVSNSLSLISCGSFPGGQVA